MVMVSPQDIVYAYAWFNLAASKDTFVYKNARDRLKILLTPKQVEEGQKLSRELFEKYGGLEK